MKARLVKSGKKAFVAQPGSGARRKSWARNTVVKRAVDAGWETATWEGSRRAQLRAVLALTVRERFQALEYLAELAQRLATMPRRQGPVGKTGP